jgi:hypothetical protein
VKTPGHHTSVADLRATRRETTMYHVTILARSAGTFTAMVFCHLGYLPVWGLLLANLVLYPEIYLRVHDIGHSCAVSRFGLTARFVPVSNPLWGGTRVFAVVHAEHHTHLGTDKDPWLPYYTGHPLQALLYNLIEPEYSLRSFIRLRGVDRELVMNALYNAACLVVSLALFQWVYVIHLVSQRIIHGAGIFFFNFYPHRATLSSSAPVGVWERADDLRAILPLLRAVWGNDTIDGLIYHNRHHCTGQNHVPVRNYKYLTDTGVYTRSGSGSR